MEKFRNILGIGSKQSDPEKMPFAAVKVLALFSVALGITLLASNLAALKVWNLFGIPVDGGIWLFPITYIVGDLLVEIYGQKVANYVSFYCTFFAVLVAAVLFFAKALLPDFPGVDNSAFEIIQSATGRIFLASVAGFFVSQIVNNGIFAKIRARSHKTDTSSGFRTRALLSSAVAHIPDCLIFETLAFIGRVSLSDFFLQASFAYLAGILLEIIFSFISAPLATYLSRKLHYTNGHNLTTA